MQSSSLDDSWILESEAAELWSEDSPDEREDDDETPTTVSKLTSRSSATLTPLQQTPQRSRLSSSTEPQFYMPTPTTSVSALQQPRFRPAAARHASSNQFSPSRKHRHAAQAHLSQAPGVRSDNGFISGLFWTELLLPMFRYLTSTIGFAMGVLKPVFGILLALWTISWFVSHYLSPLAFTGALSSICSIPLVSSAIPICALPTVSRDASAPEFDALMHVQSNFDKILESSLTTANLPLDMKRSETSLRDLRNVVQFSTVPSKNELLFELTGFVDSARQASADLSRFNSRIGRAVDAVLSTNRWTLQVLDGISEHASATSNSLSLFTWFFPRAIQSEELVLHQYLRHVRVVEEQIAQLVLEAQTLLGMLQGLDDRLDVIGGVARRDGLAAQADRALLFTSLWTWLGGNRAGVRRVADNMRVLADVSAYHRLAFEHVSLTIVALQDVAAGLEDLRERVVAPDIEASMDDRGPVQKIPLRVHIENIQMGIDRLEKRRGEGREIEGRERRKVLDRGAAVVVEGRKEIDG